MSRVIGFRKWYLLPKLDDGQLWPLMSLSGPWTPGVNRAECSKLSTAPRKPCEEPPGDECLCGIHAVHAPDAPILSMSFGRWPIGGAIAAWGKMAVGPKGFRAEFAEIVAVSPSRRFTRDQHPEHRSAYMRKVALVAERYGVPVIAHEELKGEALLVGSLAYEAEDEHGSD